MRFPFRSSLSQPSLSRQKPAAEKTRQTLNFMNFAIVAGRD
jgi:hypothetical protein